MNRASDFAPTTQRNVRRNQLSGQYHCDKSQCYVFGKALAVCTGQQEAEMNWLNNVITDLQKRILGDDESSLANDATTEQLKERRAAERARQFQARLHDLDRRLAELR